MKLIQLRGLDRSVFLTARGLVLSIFRRILCELGYDEIWDKEFAVFKLHSYPKQVCRYFQLVIVRRYSAVVIGEYPA